VPTIPLFLLLLSLSRGGFRFFFLSFLFV